MDFDFSQLSDLIAPYIAILIGLVASLIAKDFASSMAAGLSFKYNPQFNEGDNVLIDGEPARIVKVGYKHTVFNVQKPDGQTTWRYVKNERIENLKLEKVMTDPQSTK